MPHTQEYEIELRSTRRYRFRDHRRKQYYAQREWYLTETYGPFRWKVRAWRNHWIVRHFLWAYLIWKIIVQPALDLLIIVVIVGVPVLLLFVLGALFGRFIWR